MHQQDKKPNRPAMPGRRKEVQDNKITRADLPGLLKARDLTGMGAYDSRLLDELIAQAQAAPDEAVEYREARVISFRPGMGEVTFRVEGGVPWFMDPGHTIYVSHTHPAPSQPSGRELEVLREYRNACIAFNNSFGAETDTLEEAVEIERKAEQRLEDAEQACHDFYRSTPHPDQPQASAAQSAPTDESGVVKAAREILTILQHPTRSVTAMDMWKLEDALKAHDEAAQSAPAGQREAAIKAAYAAVVEGGWSSVKELGIEMFQAGAAWQLAQSAPMVPEGWRAGVEAVAKMLEKKADDYAREHGHTDMGGLEFSSESAREYFWALTELEEEVRAMLATAPAQPAAQDRGEVRSEWLLCSDSLPVDKRDVLVYCADSDEHMVGSSIGGGLFLFATASHGEKVVCRPTHWRYIDESDKPDLDASTGQEVKP